MANVSDATEATFAEQEDAVLPSLAGLGVADVARAMQLWRQRAEATLPTAPLLASPSGRCISPRPWTGGGCSRATSMPRVAAW